MPFRDSLLKARVFGRAGAADFAAFALVAALQLALTLTHVPWFDEIQAFVLARESTDLRSWWENFRFEGHPPLWHIVIKIGQLFVEGLSALTVVQAVIALAIQALIFFATPFALATRLLIGLGYFMLFEYGALARAYGLGVLLILAATAWRGRVIGYAALVLLPFVAAQFALLALLLGLLFRREGKAPTLLLGVVALAIALAYLFARPPADFTHADARHASLLTRALATLAQSSGALLPFDPSAAPLVWENRLANPFIAMAIGTLVPLLAYRALRDDFWKALAVIAFWGATFVISLFLALMTNRHFGLVFVLLIAMEWLRLEAGATMSRVSLAWTVLMAALGLFAALFALRIPFAPGPKVAAFLRQEAYARLPVVAYPPLIGIDLVARNNSEPINLVKNCRDRFQIWDYYRHAPIPPAKVRAALEDLAGRLGGKLILLVQSEEIDKIGPLAPPIYRRIAAFESAMFYRAVIYEISVAVTEPRLDPLSLPACLARMRG